MNLVESVEELFPHWERMPPGRNPWHDQAEVWYTDVGFITLSKNNKPVISYKFKIPVFDHPDIEVRAQISYAEFAGQIDSVDELKPIIEYIMKMCAQLTKKGNRHIEIKA